MIQCNTKCNDDIVVERKDRIQFDLNTIIKANTIQKSKNLGNSKSNQKIQKCNEKLSYLNIIEKLQLEIDNITLKILNYNFNTTENNDTEITSVIKTSISETSETSNTSNTSQANIEYLNKLLRYKIDCRNYYINLTHEIIRFREIEPT